MENAPDTSVLRVAVTTALGAQPLENALVTVSTAPDENGTRTLLYAVRTDRDGMTPPMTLGHALRALHGRGRAGRLRAAHRPARDAVRRGAGGAPRGAHASARKGVIFFACHHT